MPSSPGDRSDEADEFRERVVAEMRDAPRPVMNTRYLTSRVDRPLDDVFETLERLAERGTVEHVEVAGYGHLWWLSADAPPDECDE
jgi:hypothetical protein